LTTGALDGGHERIVDKILDQHAVTWHAEARGKGTLTTAVFSHVLTARLLDHDIVGIGSGRLATALPVSHDVPPGDAHSR